MLNTNGYFGYSHVRYNVYSSYYIYLIKNTSVKISNRMISLDNLNHEKQLVSSWCVSLSSEITVLESVVSNPQLASHLAAICINIYVPLQNIALIGPAVHIQEQ